MYRGLSICTICLVVRTVFLATLMVYLTTNYLLGCLDSLSGCVPNCPSCLLDNLSGCLDCLNIWTVCTIHRDVPKGGGSHPYILHLSAFRRHFCKFHRRSSHGKKITNLWRRKCVRRAIFRSVEVRAEGRFVPFNPYFAISPLGHYATIFIGKVTIFLLKIVKIFL